MTWMDANPGPIAIVISGFLLAYYVAVEPRWGKTAFARLTRKRLHDPGALLAFDWLTVAVQCAAVAAVVLAVLLDPGVGAATIGLVLPAAPDDAQLPVIIGGAVGIAAVVVVALVLAIRATRRGTDLPMAPAATSAMIPVTCTERWWAAAVAVGAGISEELVFRGLLLAVAVGVGLPPVLAAAVLTVVFGAAHLYQGVRGLLMATLFGGVMSVITLGTQSLLLPIVLHTAIDLRALLLTRPAQTPTWSTPRPGLPDLRACPAPQHRPVADPGSGVELVAESTDGEQMHRGGGIGLDLGAQPLDVHVEGFRVPHVVAAPHPVDELPAGQHPARVAHQVFQEVELLERQRHRTTSHGDGVPLDIQAYRSRLEHPSSPIPVELRIHAPTQHCADPGDELPRRVRLCDVVVGAQLQTEDLVDLAVAGGHHDHRDARAQPQLLTHLGAAHPGQHQIQQNDVGAAALELRERGHSVNCHDRIEILLAQQERQWLRERFLVLYDQHLAHR